MNHRTPLARAARRGVCAAGLLLPIAAAHAEVTIAASKPTSGIACAAGVCTPTAAVALLNTADLQAMLAAGSVTVTTHGPGGVQARGIRVESPVRWSGHTLVLAARGMIKISDALTVDGAGGLQLVPNDTGVVTGRLNFGSHGHVTFHHAQGMLAIGSTAYALEPNLQALAAAVTQNPAGHYALANSSDAAAEGTYSAPPIQAVLTGTVEGLGNTVSGLTVRATAAFQAGVGLFAELGTGGLVENLSVARATIVVDGAADAGILVGIIDPGATVSGIAASGLVHAHGGFAGGVAGRNGGLIQYARSFARVGGLFAGGIAGEMVGDDAPSIQTSSAAGSVTVDAYGAGGGIAGDMLSGEIFESYATATIRRGLAGAVGGLVGDLSGGNLYLCYALGPIVAKGQSRIGGRVGLQSASGLSESYASNQVDAGPGALAGGVYGAGSNARDADDYWDTTTSGIGVGTGQGNVTGIEGRTTKQLRSRLPQGFSPMYWGRRRDINGGLPYLLSVPPG